MEEKELCDFIKSNEESEVGNDEKSIAFEADEE